MIITDAFMALEMQETQLWQAIQGSRGVTTAALPQLRLYLIDLLCAAMAWESFRWAHFCHLAPALKRPRHNK